MPLMMPPLLRCYCCHYMVDTPLLAGGAVILLRHVIHAISIIFAYSLAATPPRYH